MRQWSSKGARRGVTLVEVIIVMALMGLLVSAAVVGSGQLESARLRRTSSLLTAAIRAGYSRAMATSKTVRLVMDFEERTVWLEEGDQPHLVSSKDASGTGGAEAVTAAEKVALEESGRILKGPTAPRTGFREIQDPGLAPSETGKKHRALESGVQFRSVHTAHDDAPRTKGRAYLYFWPGGTTERASIALSVGKAEGADLEKKTVTVVVAPLTGKSAVKPGLVELATPKDDAEASERQE